MFLPGNPHALKTMRRTAGERNVLVFYPESRLDGMISREEILGKKTIELYANRRDRLIYRSVTYRTATEEKTGETEQHPRPLEIRKLTEKFSRDDTRNCDDDVAKRVFYLTEDRIRLDFHFGEGRITRSSRVFHKEGHSQIVQVEGSLLTTSFDTLVEAGRSSVSKTDAFVLTRGVPSIVDCRKECSTGAIALACACSPMRVQSVRDSEKEMREILTECQNQDLHVKLVTPYYDASRDIVRFPTDEDGDSTTEAEYDYLSAYLPNAMSDAPLSKSIALCISLVRIFIQGSSLPRTREVLALPEGEVDRESQRHANAL